MRKIKKIRPIYNKFPRIIEIISDTHVVKHKIHEKSFKKNLIKKDCEKDLFVYRYSI